MLLPAEEPRILIAPGVDFTLVDLEEEEDSPSMTARDHRAVVEAKQLIDGPLDAAAVRRRWCEPAVLSFVLVATVVLLTLIVWLMVD